MSKEGIATEMYDLLTQNEVKIPRLSLRLVSEDEESAASTLTEDFNPFTDRNISSPTTECQTLTHLLKSTLGSGIMMMPYAFKSAGIVGGILAGLFTAAVCTHTSYILVECAHVLYYKTKKKKMDYDEVMEAAFSTGPEWAHKYSKIARYIVLIGIFVTYFGASSADNLLIATNFGQVYKHWTQNSTVNATNAAAELDVEESLLRIIMICVMPLLILLVWVPDLKYLAPISTIANVFMAIVIAITMYYIVPEPRAITDLSLSRPIIEFPQFFANTLFAMANIGVVMPLENNMKTPRNFLGTCGVLNRGMFGITIIYLLLGVLGYMKYGCEVNAVITVSLPITDVAAQIVKVLVGTTVLFTFSLQFYVCREMAWSSVKDRFPARPLLAEYTLRAALVIVCVSIAIAVPSVGPLVSLVGALGFSLLGVIGPVVIETVTYWEVGFGRFNWRLFKNIFLFIFGMFILLFGSYNTIAKEMLHKEDASCTNYKS